MAINPIRKLSNIFMTNKKLVITVVSVVVLFFANGAFIMAQDDINQIPVPNVAAAAPNGTVPGAFDPASGMAQGQAVPIVETKDRTAFVMPLAIVIFLLLAGFGLTYYKKNAKAIEKKLKESAKDGKGFTFAENEQQAITAIVILSLFVANGFYLITKGIIDQMPVETIAQTNPVDPAVQTPAPVDNSTANQNLAQDANNIYSQTMNLQTPTANTNPSVEVAPSSDEIEIISKGKTTKFSGKMVTIPVGSSGRSNPFLPASENISPSSLAYLTAPPETLPVGSDAGKVMTTVISGILYDKYNPSAIINIEGTDYLVKRGDIINRYKVLSITKTQVIVQLGKNIYQAGVGELLSQTNINYNTIANLNKKFGGNDVSINVKKKGY